MRFPDDYMGDMASKKALDREIEQLLAGTPIEGGRLSGLAPVVRMNRTQWTQSPTASEVAQFARRAVSAVTQSEAKAVTTLQPRRVVPRLGLTPRLATVVLAGLLMSGTAGMAMAANGAVPGDTLYGLDRAFEEVGIGSGSAEERLDEAVVMAAQGQSSQALEHAIESLSQETEDGSGAAASALVTAAENLVDMQDTTQAATTASIRVSALLTYIAENIGADEGTDGREFGQGVAQLARDIGEGDDPTGAQDPAVAPAPGQEQSNNPGAGVGHEESGDRSVPGNGDSNGNGQGNGNSEDKSTGNGDGQGNPTGSGSENSGNGNGQGGGPPVESPSVTAPGRGSGAPEDSSSVTAPGKGNKP
jgi:hypothetical protein